VTAYQGGRLRKLTDQEIAASIALDGLGLLLVPFSEPAEGGSCYGIVAKYSTDEPPAAKRARGQLFSSIENVEAFIAREREIAETVPWWPRGTARPPQQVRTTPYVGQMVHYRSYGTPGGEYPPACRAAIVTHIHEAAEPDAVYVALSVHNPEGQFFNQGVRIDPGVLRPREHVATAGVPLPLVTCEDLDFAGGTWHFIAHPEAP
jgi:hypothetical protein